jgi:hypothetical protein
VQWRLAVGSEQCPAELALPDPGGWSRPGCPVAATNLAGQSAVVDRVRPPQDIERGDSASSAGGPEKAWLNLMDLIEGARLLDYEDTESIGLASLRPRRIGST